MSKLPIHISRRDLSWRSMGAIEPDNAPNAAPSVQTEVIDEPIATRISDRSAKGPAPFITRSCNSTGDTADRKRIKARRAYLRPVQGVREVPSRRDEQVAAFGDLPRSLENRFVRLNSRRLQLQRVVKLNSRVRARDRRDRTCNLFFRAITPYAILELRESFRSFRYYRVHRVKTM